MISYPQTMIFICSCDRSIYHALGNGTFHYLKAVMTFDQVIICICVCICICICIYICICIIYLSAIEMPLSDD